jgi:hypothetical protein
MKTIKLDWDTKNYGELKHLIWRARQLENTIKSFDVLETNKGFHVYAQLSRDVRNEIIFCLEVLLLTDGQKMAFDLKRLMRGYRFWNVLFKVKLKGGKITRSEYTPLSEFVEEWFMADKFKRGIAHRLEFEYLKLRYKIFKKLNKKIPLMFWQDIKN